jgi:hypothetical protein
MFNEYFIIDYYLYRFLGLDLGIRVYILGLGFELSGFGFWV